MKLSFPKLKINKRTWLAILAVVVLALAASFYFFRGESPEAEAGWWNEEWNYRKKLTIDATKIDADLTNFPVAVILTTSNFTYANAQTNGEDIRFTDLSGNTLYHEIEKWNSSATSTVWVKIPQVDDTTDTVFYMYYGNGSVADGQNKTAVWDDGFAAVYHLSETTGDHFDSTKYANNTTYTNAETQGSYAGVLDGADFFNGSHHLVPHNISLDIVTSSISMWVRPETPGKSYNVMIAREGAGHLSTIFINATRNFCIWYSDNFNCGSYQFATGTWTHMVVETTAPDNANLYINGQYNSSVSLGFINTPGSYLAIANRPGFPVSYIGALDEIRIQNTVRSAAWHKASYENGLNNLITLAAEEKGPGPVAYWGFDEGYGTTTSDIANANDGTIYGATWKDETECVKGKCLYFDGTNDYVESIGNMGITGNNPRTVSIWFKQNISANKNLIGFGTNAETQLFEFEVENGKLLGHFYGSGNDTLTGAPTYRLNEWNHAVITYDGTKADVYLNGQYTNSKTISLNTGNSNVRIARGIYLSNNYFQGYLDEVKVYDYARSADQVKVDYNRGLSLALGGNQYASLSDGLIGWWKMDEASWNGTSNEVIDHSGNANHGTAGGGANTTSTAQFARAGYFDGSDDIVTLADNDNTDLSEAITISAWVRPTVTTNWNFIVSRGYYHDSYSFAIYSNTLMAYINGVGFRDETTTIATNQWHHVTFTYDNQATRDNVKLYLNGVNINSWNYSQPIETNSDFNTYIGDAVAESYPFDGQIDEVRMYNRALSPDEVRRLSEWAPEPVGYWKFDEGTGTTAYDSTASSTGSGGNHGTLHASMTEASWVRGKYGSALNFDGTNNLVTVDSEKLTIDHGSISAWINWTGESGFTYNIAAKAVDTSGYVFGVVDNKLKFHCHNNPLGAGGYYAIDFSSTNNIPQNQWTHVAVTFQHASGSTAYLYINGQQAASSSMVANCLAPSSGDFTIGDSSATGLYWGKWQGMIDDVKVYNYARNQRQILEDMNAGKKNNPIGYWSFDEGQGGTAYDRGYLATLGSGNNGTLINMTTSGPSSVWSPSGKAGKALQFDGVNDYIAITNNNITNYNQSRSVSLWFKTNTLGSQKGIIGTGNTVLENNPFWLLTQSDNDKISLYHAGYHDGITTLERNKWYHLVYTYDRASRYLVLYLDGKVEYAGTVNDVDNDKNNIYIGGGWGGYFNGQIDEVKIYNYSLTLDEIRQNYNVGQQIVLSRSANDNLTDGLLAYWPMDGNLTDFSGNGNTGTASGATVTSSAKFGQAYAIGGGTNYISVPTSDSLDSYTDKLTVSGWYYFNNLDAVQQWLFDKANNYYLRVGSTGAFTNYLIGINNADYWTTQAGLVTAGRWYYVVFTYDGQERKIYIDGVLKASRKDTGNINTGGNLNIGNRNSQIEPMDGQVDDIKIYNRVLSADEIAQSYVDGPKPVAYWKFDEGDGLTAYDASGGNHLTLGYSTYEEPSWEPIGKIGSGINLRGSVRNEAAAILDSNLSSDFPGKNGTGTNYGMSAMAWIKLNSYKQKQDYLCKGSGSWCFWVLDGKLTEYATQIFSDTLLPLNQWVHIAYTYDGQTAKIYIDGILDTQKADTEGIPVHDAVFAIGSVGDDSPDGMIDEAKVYNYARTQRQILEDMNAGQKSSPIGYWKFDEGQGNVANDYSGYGNHGTLIVGSGGTQSATSSAWTNGVSGKINGSLNFDGTDDRVNLGSVTTGENVSIAAWIKTTSSLQKPIFSNRGSGVYFGISSGTFFVYDNSASPSPSMNSNKLINDGAWHHVVWTSNGSSSAMYIDGELDSRQAQSRGSDSGTSYIGWDAANSTEYFLGQIDEVKIWNYPLTPAEIKKEYNGGFSSYFR